MPHPISPEGDSPHSLIRNIRNGLNMTQAQLAERAGMQQSHVARIESGKVDVQVGTLRKLLRAMGRDLALTAKPTSRAHWPVRILAKEDPLDSLRFWLRKSPAERIAAVESLRRQMHLVTGASEYPRIVRSVRVREGGR